MAGSGEGSCLEKLQRNVGRRNTEGNLERKEEESKVGVTQGRIFLRSFRNGMAL